MVACHLRLIVQYSGDCFTKVRSDTSERNAEAMLIYVLAMHSLLLFLQK
jgi:hypothetical protein